MSAHSSKLHSYSRGILDGAAKELGIEAEQIAYITPCLQLQITHLGKRKRDDIEPPYIYKILDIKGNLDTIHNAWQQVVLQQPQLRTCFTATPHKDHEFAQIVLKEYELQWSDTEVDSIASLASTVKDHIKLSQELLKLSKPPYRFDVFRFGVHTKLVIVMHSGLCDEQSLNLLIQDVQTICRGSMTSERPDSYLMDEYFQNMDETKIQKFWKGVMSGFEPSRFPDLTGETSSNKNKQKVRRVESLKHPESLEGIESRCTKLQISTVSLCQAVWSKLLSQYTGERDVCFGSYTNCRDLELNQVDIIVGQCSNILPLRVVVTADLTNLHLVQRFQQMNKDMREFTTVPLHHIENLSRGSEERLFDTVIRFDYDRPHDQLYDSQIWTCGWEHEGISVSDHLRHSKKHV